MKIKTDKENTSFWWVTVYNTETQKEETFKVSGDKKYRSQDIKRVLKEAHPEYTRMKAKRTKKPKAWHK